MTGMLLGQDNLAFLAIAIAAMDMTTVTSLALWNHDALPMRTVAHQRVCNRVSLSPVAPMSSGLTATPTVVQIIDRAVARMIPIPIIDMVLVALHRSSLSARHGRERGEFDRAVNTAYPGG